MYICGYSVEILRTEMRGLTEEWDEFETVRRNPEKGYIYWDEWDESEVETVRVTPSGCEHYGSNEVNRD